MKPTSRLVMLFLFTYLVSYVTRINYGAIVSEMEQALHISKRLLSMALTGSFVTYGAGQVVSGICGDRFSPKKLICLGLAVTSGMNLLLPFCRNAWQMLAVWCVNGFAQAFLWPPLVKLMATLLSEAEYSRAVVRVSWGSSFGTIAVYLLAPVLISLASWKAVFFAAALCGIVMVAVWGRTSVPSGGVPSGVSAAGGVRRRSWFHPLLWGVMAAIVLQGMLRDGVTTWMPSYISETYQISHLVSIFSGVLLPVFGILCYQAASKLYHRVFPNPLLCAGVIFAVGAGAALGLFWLSGQNAVGSVVLSALLTGCMHGVNLILICMIPPFFKRSGSVATVSGILNSCTYVGSALSTYGIALLSETYGWRLTLLIWLFIAVAGAAVCLLCARPWRARMMAENPD